MEFAPTSNLGWNSQAITAAPLDIPSDVTQVSVCYRTKIFRFKPDIYWINVFEYTDREGGTHPFCCELRSRESVRLQLTECAIMHGSWRPSLISCLVCKNGCLLPFIVASFVPWNL